MLDDIRRTLNALEALLNAYAEYDEDNRPTLAGEYERAIVTSNDTSLLCVLGWTSDPGRYLAYVVREKPRALLVETYLERYVLDDRRHVATLLRTLANVGIDAYSPSPRLLADVLVVANRLNLTWTSDQRLQLRALVATRS